MSRDAKVGLVIVFAFVFLLGTILVHRFHLTDLEQLTGGNGTAAVDPDANAASSDSASDDNPLGTSGSNTVTTVDAQPEANLNQTLPGGRTSQQFESTLTGSQQVTGQSNLNRPPEELRDTSDSGAHITLTDPRDQQESAAVVESRGSSSKSRGHESISGQSSESEMPAARPDLTHRSPPPLDISPRSPGTARTTRGIPDTEDEVPSSPGEVSSMDSKEPTSGVPVEATDPPESEPDSIVETPPGRRIPPLNRPPALEPDDIPEEMTTGDTSIRQAADKGRPESEDSTPPKLPKYGDPPQAIIESVPDRDTRLAPRGPDRSTDATEPFSPPNRTPPTRPNRSDDTQVAGQKTYVVKEGDSFWSISAKQYGTGKYFRALEEYNKDRLSASGSGGKVLRPGIVIALPDESLLQSNNARKKPAEPASSNRSTPDPWKVDSSTGTPAKRDTAAAPKREVPSPPGTYRVKDGDTLSTIALRELGTSKRWQEIFQLNRDRLTDETSLRPGMDLKMPSTATAEKAAGRPNF